jgi:hypothetical protein
VRGLVAVALSVLLVGCAPAREPPPSGRPVGLEATLVGPCPSAGGVWIEGSLQWDGRGGPMRIEPLSPDTVDWLEPFGRQDYVRVTWPEGFIGVLVGDDVAVVDASGGLVAVTGDTYRFRGVWFSLLGAPADGGESYSSFGGLSMCRDPASVVRI